MSEELAQPYSIEVEKERGGFLWKLRVRGKLMVRSQHLYRTAEKAQEERLEQLQRLQHGARQREDPISPECGSRRVTLLFDVPKVPVAARAKLATER